MLSCLLRPTAGTATILGHDVRTEPLAVKRVTAISPQETAIAEHLDAWENLALMAGVHGIDKEVTRERSDELLETMALTKRGKEKAKHYSGGMKRRLSIAMALITEPQVVFLDEPTIGLGPQSRRGMWEYIAGLKGSTTIVLTTHYPAWADVLDAAANTMTPGTTAERPAKPPPARGESDATRYAKKRDIHPKKGQ